MVVAVAVSREGYFIQLVNVTQIYVVRREAGRFKTFRLYETVFTFSEN